MVQECMDGCVLFMPSSLASPPFSVAMNAAQCSKKVLACMTVYPFRRVVTGTIARVGLLPESDRIITATASLIALQQREKIL